MHSNQWLDRWKQDRIGFHEPVVNPYLVHYLPRFNLSPGDTIFLPLCGKALDIAWLAEKGFQVIGVELSEIAIGSFFEEHKMNYQKFESDRFVLYKSGNINLLQGDYFSLRAEDLSGCKLVYDRASLIAIDAEHRAQYCEHMRFITPDDTGMLLVTLDYEQALMEGPPYAVARHEVERHYQSHYAIEVMEQKEVIDERPRWRDQGLTSLTETVFSLVRAAIL